MYTENQVKDIIGDMRERMRIELDLTDEQMTAAEHDFAAGSANFIKFTGLSMYNGADGDRCPCPSCNARRDEFGPSDERDGDAGVALMELDLAALGNILKVALGQKNPAQLLERTKLNVKARVERVRVAGEVALRQLDVMYNAVDGSKEQKAAYDVIDEMFDVMGLTSEKN